MVSGVAFDEEMKARIAKHRADRPAEFTTVEAPQDLTGAVTSIPSDTLVVIDCVTVWLSNRMVDGADNAELASDVERLAAAIAGRAGDTIVVSNEVGLGIVPVNEMAREFRDIQGRANAVLAQTVDECVLMVAGRALRLTDPADLWG